MVKKLLITGGCGSLGTELVERLNKKYNIVIFSRDEQKHQRMKREYPNIEFIIGDVRNQESVKDAVSKVDHVIHTAAMKHIDVCETNIWEAIQTNVLGSRNIINACKEFGIRKFISIGTDKQVEPINVYGMCKAIQEKLAISAGYNCVRYGNVMWSNGSVFKLFEELVSKNKALPLTNPNMTRFLLPLKHAHDLIDKAFERMSGEIFIRKSPGCTLKSLADVFSKKQIIVGERPGEKMHECLITADEMRKTYEEKDYYILTTKVRNNKYERYSSNLTELLDGKELKSWIFQ